GNRPVKFSYGYSSLKGKRASMEDFFETRISDVDGQMVAFFGVFDGTLSLSLSLSLSLIWLILMHFVALGHGGARTAEYLKNNLFKNLVTHDEFISDTKKAIEFRFWQCKCLSRRMRSIWLKRQPKNAGSTASTALLVGDKLIVANVGDSRVVASRNGSAVPLSNDHKPDRSDERQRIEDAGGFIIWAGTWRVGGILAVCRFGDKQLKPYEEDISTLDFIVIASDGLWNVLSNKDAMDITRDISDRSLA
ncbi:hypothetical protein Bca52824_096923, partial [Brassica carinata]